MLVQGHGTPMWADDPVRRQNGWCQILLRRKVRGQEGNVGQGNISSYVTISDSNYFRRSH